MLIFQLWFRSERERIMREGMAAALDDALAKCGTEEQKAITRRIFEDTAVRDADKLHPLRILFN